MAEPDAPFPWVLPALWAQASKDLAVPSPSSLLGAEWTPCCLQPQLGGQGQPGRGPVCTIVGGQSGERKQAATNWGGHFLEVALPSVTGSLS